MPRRRPPNRKKTTRSAGDARPSGRAASRSNRRSRSRAPVQQPSTDDAQDALETTARIAAEAQQSGQQPASPRGRSRGGRAARSAPSVRALVNDDPRHPVFGVATPAGLAPLARSELKVAGADVADTLRIRDYDWLQGALSANGRSKNVKGDTAGWRDLAELRICEDVFTVLGSLPLCQGGALSRALKYCLDKQLVLNAIAAKNTFHGTTGPRANRPSFTCFVRQDQDYSVHRKELGSAVEAAVALNFPHWRISDPASLEFWLFVVQGQIIVALRLSDQRMKYRGSAPPERAGALLPVVAAGMIRVLSVRAGDRVIDPMCGTGTLLLECAAQAQKDRLSISLRGADADPEVVVLARARAERAPGGAQIELLTAISRPGADPKQMPFGDEQWDGIICNLPWGQQYPIPRGFAQIMEQWLGRLAPGGRAVLLSGDPDGLAAVLKDATAGAAGEYAVRQITRITVRGTRAALFSVVRARAALA